MSALIGIDVGTSGTKTLLIDEAGGVLASATQEYPLYTPRPGWAEQDPEDWWQAAKTTVAEVLSKSGIRPAEIKGVGLSGQMHGSVFLDKDDRVIRPALLWCDQRTADQCAWITEKVGKDRVVAAVLNPVLTGFTAGKIVWLRDNEPENFGQLRKVLLPKDYVRFRLTGEYATEVSDASGTALFDVRRRRWSDVMLDGCGIPKEWMPASYESFEISGKISRAVAAETGLPEGTPVVGGGGDQAAGAVGNGIVRTGVVSSTMGTSGVVFAFADEPVFDPGLRVHTFCHAVPGKWHVMGVVLSAGGSLRWYRDTLSEMETAVGKAAGRDPYEIIAMEAAQAPAGSEGLIFLPYLTGERTPHADPYARGVFFGLTLRHSRAHTARSVMEGAAYAMRDSFEIFKEMSVPVSQVRASGGGARSPFWRQMQADITGQTHVTINADEGPAFGVALLAAVGTGLYASVEEACDAAIQVVTKTPPVPAITAVYNDFYPIYSALYGSLKPHFAEVQRAVERHV
ncbi:MAG: xylulokinase [Armatimonadetes bacterium]|nr:xylulokinase [Armatimonadota bacterium]